MINNDKITGGPDIKDRKTGLVVFGVFEILLGAFSALMLPLMIFGTVTSAHLGKDSASSVNVGTMIPGLLFYVLLAVWFIWMGIGSIQARRWARALLLVTSWFWLISGMIGLVFILVFLPNMYDQMGKSGHMPQQVVAITKCVTIGFMAVFYIIIPGAFVLFYGSKHTKATCEQRDARVRWTDKCPLPVLALGLMSGCWAACMPLTGFYGWAIPFFGFILSGIAGAGVVFICSLLLGYVAWGMYRLSVNAWWCAVLLTILWGISTGITFSRVSLMEFYEKMQLPAHQLEFVKQLMLPLVPWMVLFCGLCVVIALVYLLYTRKYFAIMSVTTSTAQTGAEGPSSFQEAANDSNLAIYALALSIMAALGMLFGIGLVFSIAAIVLGHISRSQIKASGGKLTGNEIAAASLVIGYISGCVSLVIILSILAFAVPAYRQSLPPREVRQQIVELKKATPDQRYDAVMEKLSAGKQSEAEQLLDALIRKYPSDQRLFFFYAVCARSRWSMAQSEWGFRRVLELDPSTLEGNCAKYVIELEEKRNIPKNMNSLRLMIKQNPDNPLLLWIMGIECRDYYKHTDETTYSRDAEQCYRQLLEIFDIGPVMVHHTFANVLGELDLNKEALEHNRIAVKMEPFSWSYEGLACTLSGMRKYDEANKVYAKIVQLDPDNTRYWRNWAISLEEQGQYEECIEKTKRVLELDPTDFMDYNRWGTCLKEQKKYEEALEILKKSMKVNPAQRRAHEDAAEILEKLGRDAEAQCYLGKAVEWIQQEADHGNAESQYNLGVCYYKGEGVAKDFTKAVEWYRKAADQGYARAQNNLGQRYEKGEGVVKDFTKAVELYKKAADQGHDRAQCNLGWCYEHGIGVATNFTKAVEWYQKAADQGYATAQSNLGGCYNYGRGVTGDMVKAIEWWQKAANQGYANAQWAVGECYATGDGVTKDLVKAKEWYQKAAAQGHAKAKKSLANMQAK